MRAMAQATGNGVDARLSLLEQEVAANKVQLATLEKTVSTISQPTNWIAIIGVVVVTFGMMVAFVKLIADPISAKQEDLWTQHYAILDRFNEHVRDGHPQSVRELIQANKEADLERARMNEQRAKEITDASAERSKQLAEMNEKEGERLRERVQKIEDYAHQTVGRKP